MYSDRGSNLRKAATYVQKGSLDSWDWDGVAQKAAQSGTKWRFAPPGCQWRDGLAESRVKALKKSMEHITNEGPLNYAEYCTVLARIETIYNARPLGIRHHGGAEGDLVPITPNLLMLNRTECGDSGDDQYDDTPEKYTKCQKFTEDVLNLWWQVWYSQVFSSLVPFKRWKNIEKNVKPGDICFVKYENKVTRADYRMCRVKSVEKDEKGLVRTAKILMRPKKSKEKGLPYIGYKEDIMDNKDMGIQRLVILCPAEEVKSVGIVNVSIVKGVFSVILSPSPESCLQSCCPGFLL